MATETNNERKIIRRFNEIMAVVLVALVSILIFLCLVTYSPNDWSFKHRIFSEERRIGSESLAQLSLICYFKSVGLSGLCPARSFGRCSVAIF